MSDSSSTPGTTAGWYRDPFGQADGRYWDGTRWSDAVSRGGVTLKVPPDPDQAGIPPVPGTELRPPAAAPSPGYAGASQPAPSAPSRSGTGVIVAVVLVVIVVAGVAFLLFRDDGGDDSPTTPSSVAPPVTEVQPTTPSTTAAPPVTETPATTPSTAAP
ncbi:MAG: DUF2510 domain-containing protein [Acidimicrobiales bacterium]|nr:DUF2510 domain-containing protein [Acidimicrobiales bacterium]